MNKTPQELVDRFIETRDAVRAAFRMENEYIYPVCAQIFLAADKPVEIEQLERCKALVKSSTSVFSSFRGNVKLPLLCMLAAGDDPEERWDRTRRYYALLKESFYGSEYLALGAMLLSDAVQEEDVPALAARGKGLYQRMKKEHPFLTGQEDSVFALLLSQSARSDDELIEDMEKCYGLLTDGDERTPGDGGHVAREGTARLGFERRGAQLRPNRYAVRHELGRKLTPCTRHIGHDHHSAAHAICRKPGYLACHQLGLDKRARSMHAAMLLSLQHEAEPKQPVELVGAAAQQATLAIIAAQQALMCAVVASSAASSAATSH